MAKHRFFITIVVLFSAIHMTSAQTAKPVDLLNVPGPILLIKESFQLAWSSHPSPAYYKHEYVVAKDNVEHFKKMVLIEVLLGDLKAATIAKSKAGELQQLRQGNPLVNYEIFQKNGEIMIDFILSQNAADGKTVDIVERNVYRYKDITLKNGKKGVLLFGASERAYGKDVDQFLSTLKATKAALTNAVAAYTLPQINTVTN